MPIPGRAHGTAAATPACARHGRDSSGGPAPKHVPGPVHWLLAVEFALSTLEAIHDVKAMLARGDIRQALIYLNRQSGYRFTSLYRFDGEMLRNVEFYDHDRPDLARTDDIALMASYCVFVRDSGGAFHTPDSMEDRRLQGHPKRRQVRSYCGVPLIDDRGRVFGTVCHFDFEPLAFKRADLELLESLAPLLQRGVQLR